MASKFVSSITKPTGVAGIAGIISNAVGNVVRQQVSNAVQGSGTSGGSGGTGVTGGNGNGYTGGGTYNPVTGSNTDYYQSAINAAQAGDWNAVDRYLTERERKVQATGQNYGLTSTQIRQQLQEQYGAPQAEYPDFEDFLAQLGADQVSAQTQARIQAAVQQAVNGYNQQIAATNRDSEELARQAYIAKMLGQKNLDQQLSAAGYAGGMADSQRIQTETAYQTNLKDIENQKAETVRQLQQAIQDAQLAGDMQAAQELASYLQTLQSQWLSYVQTQQQRQDSNYWNQQQLQNSNYWNQQQVSADQKNTAYQRAMELLSLGVMPPDDVLSAANLSAAEAAAIRNYYLQQAAPATTVRNSGSGSGGTSGGGGYNNGSLTTEQVQALQRAYGVTADGMWGQNSYAAAGGMSADEAWANYQQQNQAAGSYDALGTAARSLLFSIRSSMRNSGASGLTTQQKANLDAALTKGTITQGEYNYILNTLGY